MVVISFKISIFALANTTLLGCVQAEQLVVISFKISIFALANTTRGCIGNRRTALWLALKLVSLHWQIQLSYINSLSAQVVISFKISIFALANTTVLGGYIKFHELWLALKLVSLHWQIQLPQEIDGITMRCD